MDFETGRLYVADKGNNRINVFESGGTNFLFAFGWGVDTGANELQTCTTASGCNAGIAGSGAGQFSFPSWIAVDSNATSAAHHDLYVGTDNFRVQKFKPNGEFVKSFGSQGTGPCQFNNENDPIAVGPNGVVNVADSFKQGAPNNFVNRIVQFDSEGNCLPTEHKLFEGVSQTILFSAVDSIGNYYVVVEGAGRVLRKYSPSGTLLSELDQGTETQGIAVDASDNIFARQRGTQKTVSRLMYFLTEYDAGGAKIRRFGYALGPFIVPSLAAYSSPDGDLFSSEGNAGIRYLKFPPPGPVIFPEACKVKTGALGSTNAVLQAEVNPEGKATTFHFEYLTQTQFEAGGYSNPAVVKTPETPLPGPGDFELQEAAFKAEALKPETTYHCRVVAKNADGEAPIGLDATLDGTFTTQEGFVFGPAWSEEVGATTAKINAEGNPLGTPAEAQIEYDEDGSDFSKAVKVPIPPLNYGSSETMQLRSVTLQGLKPATLYHYRLHVTNGIPPEGFHCPKKAATCPEFEHTFRTPGGSSSGAPDGRGYELVSPSDKNSAEVAVPGFAGGLSLDNSTTIQSSSGSGEAMTYTSWTSFGKPEGAPGTSQYLAKRGPSGWSTENISPFGFQSGALTPPYRGFSADLDFGAFPVLQPALAPGCQEGAENLYLRNNQTRALQCLTIEALKQGEALCIFDFAGANEDGSRVFFAAAGSYPSTGAPEGDGFSLYEWSAEGLHLVSVLPDGTKVAPTLRTHFGAGGGHCQTGQKILHNVISKDGSKAFWTYDPEEGSKPTQLFARVNHSESIQLDAKQSGGGTSGNGVFWAASADGSIVYFTSENRLVTGSRAEPGAPDLYRYDFGKAPAERLTDVTKKGLLVADVQGVVGASEDGSYVYFVAKAALTGPSEVNEAGLHAEEGKDNLYIFHNGATTFIATLAPNDPLDAGDWSEQPRSLSARVSHDGRHLAFLSIEAQDLADYDNTIAKGQHCQLATLLNAEFVGGPLCPQAFLYDANTGNLACASCNPTGARPQGPSLLPGWTNMYEGGRYLSANGARLFFESYDALLGADESQKRDVYEFELPGEGSCAASSPSFDPGSGGCHFLISSGKSTDENFLLDASADGRDVFIATRDRLVEWADQNGNYDVYDFRVGGGFTEPTKPVICVGEGCKAPPSAPPATPTPATPTFTGPPNAKPKPKPKHHKKKHKQKKKKHKAKSNNKRGGKK